MTGGSDVLISTGYGLATDVGDKVEEEGEEDDDLTGPGDDHEDDTFSAASRQLPAAGQTGILDPSLSSQLLICRRSARVAVLWNDFAQEAAAFLNALGEPYEVLRPDFSPAVAALYPVMLIPSGGLYGLESSASFRARLEEHVAQGIVLPRCGLLYPELPRMNSRPEMQNAL